MEWIQRNPKKAVGLSALAVLVVAVFVWGMSRGSTASAEQSTTPNAILATPTTSPLHKLRPLSTASASAAPDALPSAPGAFPTGGMGVDSGLAGTGYGASLPRHRVVITAGGDGPLMGVGWRIPLADGERSGTDKSMSRSFRHSAVTYGDPDYAQLYTYIGPDSSRVWCTITVDGKVTDHREATGPWGQVFCQG